MHLWLHAVKCGGVFWICFSQKIGLRPQDHPALCPQPVCGNFVRLFINLFELNIVIKIVRLGQLNSESGSRILSARIGAEDPRGG